MKPDIDTIVTDLLTHNPDLGVEAATLRTMVAEMLERQPQVTVDEGFRARLRAELLRSVPAPKAKHLALPWWLVYTVPVGVTAWLFLLIQPEQPTLPPATTSPDTFEVAPAQFEAEGTVGKRAVETSDTTGTADVPMATGAADSPMSTGLAEDARLYQTPVGTTDTFALVVTPDRRAIRLADVAVSQPAFIHITSATGGEAISRLLFPGESGNFTLPIGTAIPRGTTLMATLYYDNGDGVFSLQNDTPAIDTAGQPITVTVVVQ